jgi:predicted nucleotidyltransferase
MSSFVILPRPHMEWRGLIGSLAAKGPVKDYARRAAPRSTGNRAGVIAHESWRHSRKINNELTAPQLAAVGQFDMSMHAIALVPLGNVRGEIEAQTGAAAALIDALHIV